MTTCNGCTGTCCTGIGSDPCTCEPDPMTTPRPERRDPDMDYERRDEMLAIAFPTTPRPEAPVYVQMDPLYRAHEAKYIDHAPTTSLSCPDCDDLRAEERRLLATPRPEALTAEEVANLRTLWTGPLAIPGTEPADTIRRLLDTLDAARAARPETGLREALADIIGAPSTGTHSCWATAKLARARAALATPPADALLDVERLAEAMGHLGLLNYPDTAVDLAAEYARLAARLTDGDG